MKSKNISVRLEGKALVLARSRSAEIVQGLPDISGEDGRYGFSKSWEWTHEIPTPENWDGATPIPVTFSVAADDSASFTFAGTTIFSQYKAGIHKVSKTVNLLPGFYKASMSFTNIDYDPPSGNVAALSWCISVGSANPVEPAFPLPPSNPPETPCPCGNNNEQDGAANFETTAGTQNLARARRFTARNNSISHSSAGKNTRLATTESCMSWNTDFGKFRGMAGVPAGSLEIFASEFSSDLGTPKCLEFNHPLNSWIATTVAGIGAGTRMLFCAIMSMMSWDVRTDCGNDSRRRAHLRLR